MGARGPKPGWKAALPAVASVPSPALSSWDRENPDKLSGEPLRELAHRRGLARSAVASMSDDKIRTELRYLTYRQYEAA